MPLSSVNVAIVGAGPYGLSLAAHLRERGVEHRIFGRPMQAWRDMPSGMYLKSWAFANSIQAPGNRVTLPAYCLARGLDDYGSVEIATFARYGMSVQQELVPHLEQTNVTDLRRLNDLFMLTLESGERVWAHSVVIAIGLSYFEQMPDVLAGLPSDLASHTAQHSDFAAFVGREVAVMGAGQSALQAAALLHEQGARVQLIARRQAIVWGGWGPRQRNLLQRIRVPHTTIGPGWPKWVLEHVPMLLHHFPDQRRLRYTQTKLGPSGSWWLRARVEGQLPINTGTAVVHATADSSDTKVRLSLDEPSVGVRDLVVDHVMAGTGFKIDVDRLSFLNTELAKQVNRLDDAPRLSRHFESSVRGLYFIGPASAASFGPLFRFVAGSWYTVPHVARHLARRSGQTGAPRRAPAGRLKIDPLRREAS